MRVLHTAPLLCAMLWVPGPGSAQTLLIERARAETDAMPARGLAAVVVEARLGAPREKLEPRGGQRAQWPAISRWVYPDFTVYFEQDHVIDVVATQSGPKEIGPRPAIR